VGEEERPQCACVCVGNSRNSDIPHETFIIDKPTLLLLLLLLPPHHVGYPICFLRFFIFIFVAIPFRHVLSHKTFPLLFSKFFNLPFLEPTRVWDVSGWDPACVHLGASPTFFFLPLFFGTPIRFMSDTHDFLQRSVRDTNAKAQSESGHTEEQCRQPGGYGRDFQTHFVSNTYAHTTSWQHDYSNGETTNADTPRPLFPCAYASQSVCCDCQAFGCVDTGKIKGHRSFQPLIRLNISNRSKLPTEERLCRATFIHLMRKRGRFKGIKSDGIRLTTK